MTVVLLDRPAPGVARLLINRPDKRNAIDHAVRQGLIDRLGRGRIAWPVLDHSDPAEWLGRPLNSRGIATPDVRQDRHHFIIGQSIDGGVKLVPCNRHADSVRRRTPYRPGRWTFAPIHSAGRSRTVTPRRSNIPTAGSTMRGSWR